MAELRQRSTAKAAEPAPIPIKEQVKAADKSAEKFKLTDLLRILGGLLLLNGALSYFVTGDLYAWGYRPWWSNPSQLRRWMSGPVLLTDAQLAAYDGSDPSKPIYLALNGTIYDVTTGVRFYGPGGSYGVLSGKDATRAFITGCFGEDLTPDIRGVEEMFIPVDNPKEDSELSPGKAKTRRERENRLAKQQVRDGINGWAKLFSGETGKNYFEVGKVVREEGWLEKLPKRTLCENAQKKRKMRGLLDPHRHAHAAGGDHSHGHGHGHSHGNSNGGGHGHAH